MPLTPLTPSTRRTLSPAVVVGASLALVAGGFVLGRVLQPTMPIVRVEARECPPPPVQEPLVQAAEALDMSSLPSITWASTVRGFSSQYSTASWSAQEVLGAPNVYPQHGDLVHAWAPLTPDSQDEWIEVGFVDPRRISAVEIYETYNPGSIDKVELITASGQTIVAPRGQSDRSIAVDGRGPTAQRHVVDLGAHCTNAAIVGVRVHLGSKRVAGWNELDAIGVATCND